METAHRTTPSRGPHPAQRTGEVPPGQGGGGEDPAPRSSERLPGSWSTGYGSAGSWKCRVRGRSTKPSRILRSRPAGLESGPPGWRAAPRIPSSALSPGLGETRVGGCCERQPAPTPPSPQWGARGQVCVEGVRRRRKGPRAQRSRWAERQRASLPALASASSEKVTRAARRGLPAGLGGAGLGGRRLRGRKRVLAEP